MEQITKTRKAVCIMANEFKKAGYTLSQAFRKAWSRVKLSMTSRVTGTTFLNRQERLAYISQFKPDDLKVTLQRDIRNPYDKNAIKVLISILPIRKYTDVGYLPQGLARELAKVMDAGVGLKVTLRGIIGGYSYKETLGVLINIAI